MGKLLLVQDRYLSLVAADITKRTCRRRLTRTRWSHSNLIALWPSHWSKIISEGIVNGKKVTTLLDFKTYSIKESNKKNIHFKKYPIKIIYFWELLKKKKKIGKRVIKQRIAEKEIINGQIIRKHRL